MDWTKFMFAASAVLFLMTAIAYVVYLWAGFMYDVDKCRSVASDLSRIDLVYVKVKCSSCGEKLGKICLLVDTEDKESGVLGKLEAICDNCRDRRR